MIETVELIGIQHTRFKPQDSDREIVGINLYVTMERDRVRGKACERVFVKESAVQDIDLKLGDEIEFVYNRYGKVEQVRHSV